MRRLAMLQIYMKDANYSEPAMKRWDLKNKQCGDKIKVTESLVILMCVSTSTITIFRRRSDDMDEIMTKTFKGQSVYCN